MEKYFYSKNILGLQFQLLQSGHFQILKPKMVQSMVLAKWKVHIDPVKHCEVYKSEGCVFVDGWSCTVEVCEIRRYYNLKNKKI